MHKKKIIRIVCLVIWMLFIFIMSATPGDISSKESDFIVNLLRMLGIEDSGQCSLTLSYIVRKTAHMSEYCILCILAYRVWIIYFNNKKALLFAFLTSFLYAASDEFHQYFVPQRAAAIKDVMIDSIGALIGILIIYIIGKIKQRKVKDK